MDTGDMDQGVQEESGEGGLFLSWYHPASGRTAILDELDGMVWLYLTAAGSHAVERDCPVLSTVPLPDEVDWAAVMESGAPPPLWKAVASAEAFAEGLVAEDFGTRWSEDGGSVLLLRAGRSIAMIVAAEEQGYSRALEWECPLGLPFDEAVEAETFPEVG